MALTYYRLLGFCPFKEFSDRGFVKERHTQDTEHIKCASIQTKVMFDNCNKAISGNSGVYLDSNSIFRNTPKRFYMQMLLNPFKEQFYLPSVFIKQSNMFSLYLKVVSKVSERSSVFYRIKTHTSEKTWIFFPCLLPRESYGLIVKYVVGSIKKILAINDFVLKLASFSYYKIGTDNIDREKTCQIKIPSIKDIIGVGLVGDFIHGIHVMNLSFRNIKESGYLSNNIIEGMYLNATFGLAKMGPPEKANTQIDGRRIESVETAWNYKFFHNALTLCDRYHLVSKLFKNLVISVCVGLGKVAARYCSLAKSKMVGLGLVCGNDADELSKAFATCKLTKHHNQQLIPTAQRFDVFVTLISHNDAIKTSFRQKLNKLTENKFSLVHNTRYLFGYYDTNSNRHVDFLYV